MIANEKMTDKTYKTLKEMLYEFVSQYEKESLYIFFSKVNYETEEQKQIALNTILYPNDIEIMSELDRTLDAEKISKKTGIPPQIIRQKAKEYTRYGTWVMLKKENETIKKFYENSKVK